MADLQQRSSFIPQQPTKGKVKAKGVRKVYVLSYVSYVLLFGSLIAAAAVFFYQWSLNSELAQIKQQLIAEQDSFSQSDLERIKELDTRINAVSTMLNNHISLRSIFRALEESTVGPVKLQNFSYIRSLTSERPQIALSAEADSFNTVLFQDKVLKDNAAIDEVQISNVSLQTQPADPANPDLGTTQVVTLSISALFDSAAVNYKGYVEERETQLQEEVVDNEVQEVVSGVFETEGEEETGNEEISSEEINQ